MDFSSQDLTPIQVFKSVKDFACCMYCAMRGLTSIPTQKNNRKQLLEKAAWSIAKPLQNGMEQGAWPKDTYDRIGRAMVAIGQGGFDKKCPRTAAETGLHIMENIASRKMRSEVERNKLCSQLMEAVEKDDPKAFGQLLKNAFA